jgi:O-antigen ligase
MNLEIKHIFALSSLCIFILYFIIKGFTNKSYLLFVLVFFPFMDLRLTSIEYGSFSVFDIISWILLIIKAPNFFNFTKKNYLIIYFFLISFMFISCVKSEFIQNSLLNLLKFSSIFIYSKVLIDECLNNIDLNKKIIKYLKFGCILSLIFLTIQLIFGLSFTFYPNDLSSQLQISSNIIRYPSYFQDPQKYAQYLSMLSFIFIINKEKKHSPGLLNICIFIIIIIAILLTGTRSAFGGFCAGITILIIFWGDKSKYVVSAFIFCGFLIIRNNAEFFSLFNRADDYNSSIATRYQFWKMSFDVFIEHPILGIGIGNHQYYSNNHLNMDFSIVGNKITYFGTESGYLQMLLELGIFGFLLAFLFIFKPIVSSISIYKNSHDIAIIIIISSIISWLIAFSTVNSLLDNRILITLATLLSMLIIIKNVSILHNEDFDQ